MAPASNRPPAVLSIWKGRRGVVNTALCCALAVPSAWGVWSAAERSAIVPTCTAHAAAQGLSYADFKLVGVRHASTVVCLFTQANGRTRDVYLRDLVSTFTDLWVGLAMTLELTVPAFVILWGLARSWVHLRWGSE
jgi:hypothetical protein